MQTKSLAERLKDKYQSMPVNHSLKPNIFQKLHLDPPLLIAILALIMFGLLILFSAANENYALIMKQGVRLGLAFIAMLLIAQIPPRTLYKSATPLFVISLILLIFVLIIGHTGKGAQRWLNLGIVRFQPSEIIKLTLPMMLATYLHNKTLPPSFKSVVICIVIIGFPVFATAVQPDLGTAIIIMLAGCGVLILAGLNWRIILATGVGILMSVPILWHFMRPYQKSRVLTFLNPESDPLGTGYHIIQSKIAIGSGGFFGKGWLNGSQSHLQFLPEHATDFIFSVSGEELGFIGSTLLISIYLIIVFRCLHIAINAQDTFTRLLAGSLTLTFFVSVFVNIGMVTGILPVVGLPLPLVSYGGTSFVTLLAAFGMLMSIQTHRKLMST